MQDIVKTQVICDFKGYQLQLNQETINTISQTIDIYQLSHGMVDQILFKDNDIGTERNMQNTA